eukprot:Hpha_TRINITY_DN15933_c4_g3::TRINITY_DN15933_c4_g3_i1::g.72961::m.72961
MQTCPLMQHAFDFLLHTWHRGGAGPGAGFGAGPGADGHWHALVPQLQHSMLPGQSCPWFGSQHAPLPVHGSHVGWGGTGAGLGPGPGAGPPGQAQASTPQSQQSMLLGHLEPTTLGLQHTGVPGRQGRHCSPGLGVRGGAVIGGGGGGQTPIMASTPDLEALEVMGPYRSAYAELSNFGDLPDHTTLIASGSGGSFIVDFASAVARWELELGHSVLNEPFGEKMKKVVIVYTTRSIPLLQFVTDRLRCSTLIELDVTQVAITLEGVEFDPAPLESAKESARTREPSPVPGGRCPARRGRRSDSPSPHTQSVSPLRLESPKPYGDSQQTTNSEGTDLADSQNTERDQWEGTRPVRKRRLSLSPTEDFPDLAATLEKIERSPSVRSAHSAAMSAVTVVQTQRLSLAEILENRTPAGGHVYFCGAPAILEIVQKSCRVADLHLHDTHAFDG